MNLLFYAEELTVGGAQINAINLGKALVERGHQVWFAADDGPLVSRVVSSGMDFIRVPYSSTKHPTATNIRRLVSIVKTYGIDLIQAFEYYPILEAHVASLWSGRPMYGIAAMYPLPPHYRFPKSRQLALVNGDTREHFIRKLGWNQDKVHLIVARLDCDYYRPYAPDTTNILSSHGVSPEEPVALLVSRVYEGKWPSIEMFLRTAEHWFRTRANRQPLRFVLAGGGPQLNILRERASRLPRGLAMAVGELSDIPAAMNESAVVLGMASTCQQALACGRPVIVIGNGGYSAVIDPDNFDHHAHYHFNFSEQSVAGQPETLCRQIDEAVFSRERSEALSRFGRRIAAERFDSRIGARQLEGVYENLVVGDGPSLTTRLTEAADLLLSLGSLYRYKVQRRVKRARRSPIDTGQSN